MPYVPHKNGRPARAKTTASSRTVRFTDKELRALAFNVKRDKQGRSRAELIRAACEHCGLFGRAELLV